MPEYYTGPRPFPVPLQAPQETLYSAPLYQYVRAFLTGDPFGSLPATNVIDFYAGDVLPEMFRAYRCLSETSDTGLIVSSALTADDLRYFYRAVALDIALRIVSGTGGSQYEAQVVKITTDNVDRTVQQSRTLSDALAFLTIEKSRMLARITCIALARAASPSPVLIDVVGHRRSVESRYPCGGSFALGAYAYGWFWSGIGLGSDY